MAGKTISNDVDDWDVNITSGRSYLTLNTKEIWSYRDLLLMFVKKDIITVYKQTILGPVWFVMQPIFTTLIYTVIFSNVAKIGTDNVPVILFYLGSVTLWNYFSETLNVTSKTFVENSFIFGKVYFPRLIVPLSKVISGLIKFIIQFGLFIVVWIYYLYKQAISPNIYILLMPLLLVVMGLLSLGFGLFITSMTTKYRDLVFLISFGVQLLMYATPVIYPLSQIHSHRLWLWLNPLTAIFETFKFAFFGSGGIFSPFWLAYSIAFTIVLLIVGIIVFNRVERRFIDTV